MAKRLKLDATLNSLTKTVEVENLMKIPDADKLYQLDQDMKNILDDKTLNIDEKVRKYENKLSEFRNVKNRIISNGGVSLMNQSVGDAESLRAMLMSVMSEIATSSSKEPSSSPRKRAATPSTIRRLSTRADSQDTAESEASAIYGSPSATPSAPLKRGAKASRTGSPEEFRTPISTQTSPILKNEYTTKVKELLKNKGVDVGEKVVFKIDPEIDKLDGKKKSSVSYTNQTFERALTYLLEGSPNSRAPHNSKKLRALIAARLKDFQDIDIKNHPNLKRAYEDLGQKIEWESLDG